MKKRILINSIALVIMVIVYFWDNPAFQPNSYTEPARFEMHTLSAPNTDFTLVFYGEKTLLINSSPDNNQALIGAYLKAQNVSRPDYVLYSHALSVPVFPVSSFKTAYAPSFLPYYENKDGVLHRASSDTSITLGKFRVSFSESESESALDITLTYEKSAYRFPATFAPVSASGAVFFVKRAPDGKHSEVTHASLRDILPDYDTILKGAPAPPSAPSYIGNKYTKKYHLPTCHTLPSPRSQIFFASESVAVASPFVPCKNCKP